MMKMKKIDAILFFLIFLTITVTKAQSSDGAKINFEKTTHNFGDVVQGNQVSHTFTFRNTGNQPLIISNVLTTCGCTVPDWPKEPIAPNQSGKIEVKFDSKGRSGRQNKVVTIISNAVNPQTRINVVVNILPN
jgi:uncharacterized protein (DUF58 family)